jgi:hypothetical protein
MTLVNSYIVTSAAIKIDTLITIDN